MEDPQVSLRVSKSVECDIFPFSSPTLLVERQKGIRPVKSWVVGFVGGDDLTARLIPPVVTITSSSLAPIKSRMETF